VILQIENENLREETSTRWDGEKAIRAELREKEQEIARLVEALRQQESIVKKYSEISKACSCGRQKYAPTEQFQSPPPSEAGTDSSNNGGWERMGTEWTSPDVAVGISSTSSESCAGGHESVGGITVTEVEQIEGAKEARAGSQQSSPKGAEELVKVNRIKQCKWAIYIAFIGVTRGSEIRVYHCSATGEATRDGTRAGRGAAQTIDQRCRAGRANLHE